MKKLVFILSVLFLMIGAADVQAQWLKKVGQKAVERAKERAKNKVERKVDDAVDKTVDGAFDGAEDAVKGKDKKEKTNDSTEDADGKVATQEGGQQQQKGQSLEMTYAKSDFVPGDEIIFEDNMEDEQLGEFPSKWDLLGGTGEIVAVNGKKAITRDKTGWNMDIAPLMKDMKNYLPEKFTLEMDLWFPRIGGGEASAFYKLFFYDANGSRVMETHLSGDMTWSYKSTSGKTLEGSTSFTKDYDGWYHLAISFNQRAFKAYINGVRISNIPNMTQPVRFEYSDFGMNGAAAQRLTNVRIAKGAVPLYDRMLTDGKFITYGITFDVGKSTIKPESMGEINRIVKLMTDNPGLKFSVEGHTDSTGNATANQTLSEARSKAIVDKLVELGIAADRLTSSGKGQTTPIADNGTDEGRAKNRRVEFVKI